MEHILSKGTDFYFQEFLTNRDELSKYLEHILRVKSNPLLTDKPLLESCRICSYKTVLCEHN